MQDHRLVGGTPESVLLPPSTVMLVVPSAVVMFGHDTAAASTEAISRGGRLRRRTARENKQEHTASARVPNKPFFIIDSSNIEYCIYVTRSTSAKRRERLFRINYKRTHPALYAIIKARGQSLWIKKREKKYLEPDPEVKEAVYADLKRKQDEMYECATRDKCSMRRGKGNLSRPASEFCGRTVSVFFIAAILTAMQTRRRYSSLYKNDDITRRILHVQLVSRIARNIGRMLNLNLT